MSMISIARKLSTTKLTRKEFVVYLGALFVGIIGIPSLLKVVGEVKPKPNTKRVVKKSAPRAFGSGAYGV